MACVVVLEVDEVPLRLLRWYAASRPASALAELLANSSVGESEVREPLPKDLYPSQTWASLNSGMPFERHGVYWYGDPKPVELPLHWQEAARHRRVGVVGTLHSSPLARQCHQPRMVFAASFPDDWEEPLYDDAWVNRFAGEIPAALDALDRYLGRLRRWCRATDRTLILLSSMGQVGGAPLEHVADLQLVVDDAGRFLARLGVNGGSCEVRKCMDPHVTVAFADECAAERAAERLRRVSLEGEPLDVDLHGCAVPVTYHLAPRRDGVLIDQALWQLPQAGVRPQAVEDHRRCVHHPRGVLLVANSASARLPDEPFDYLEVAPALFGALGLEPLAHHVEPSVAF